MERGACRMERRAAQGRRRRKRACRSSAGGGVMTDPQRYIAMYAAPLPTHSRARRPAVPPRLDPRHYYLGDDEPETPPLTLPQLYAAGVEFGHSEARLELKRRVEAIAEQLAEFRAIRNRAHESLRTGNGRALRAGVGNRAACVCLRIAAARDHRHSGLREAAAHLHVP